MRSGLLAVVAISLLLSWTAVAAAGKGDGIEATGQATQTETGYDLGVVAAGDSIEPFSLGSNPLVDCVFVGGLSGQDTIDVAGASGILIGLTNPEMATNTESTWVFASCRDRVFGGFTWTVWEEGEAPPDELIDALAAAARAAVVIPALTPETAPDGLDTPFLTQLPVWLWVPAEDWLPVDGTASIPELGLSITATATPSSTAWVTGADDADELTCGAGTPWEPGLDDDATDCSVTYGATTAPGETFELSVTTTYDIEFSCSPGLCAPGAIDAETFTVRVARPVTVTEARGVISR